MIFAVQMDDQCPVNYDKFPKTGFENAFEMYYIISPVMSLIIIIEWDWFRLVKNKILSSVAGIDFGKSAEDKSGNLKRSVRWGECNDFN